MKDEAPKRKDNKNSIYNSMHQYNPNEIEVIISNATKPKPISNAGYPLNDLDDRIFEILTYSIFKKRILTEPALSRRFDSIVLMQGIGERGMDSIFFKGSKISSIVQCKKYKSNLSDKQIVNELVKFVLHVLSNPALFRLDKKFTYYLATSTGYTGKANLLLSSLKSGDFVQTYDLKKITENITGRFKELATIQYFNIKDSLIAIIKKLDFEFIKPEDYNIWINDYPNLIDTFFEVKKVTDNGLIEEKSKEIISVVKEMFSIKDSQEIENFLEIYKRLAKQKFNIVNFIGFDIQKHRQRPDDITLTDLFVQPFFHQRNTETNERVYSVVTRELKITNLFKSEKNIIILGDPGAGKSLLVKFLMVVLLENQSELLGIKHLSNSLPLRIELRKYNEVKENKNILEYLIEVLNKDFQVIMPVSQLERILEIAPSIIFFDGLDEVFNITHKLKIRDDIETFSLRFNKSKCIVTSRFIGYHDAKFNPKRFDEFGILRFNEIQIKELVSKFYATQYSNLDKRNKLIANCVLQLQNDVDDELKSNPLILTLILILTSNNIIIPDSKLEIYESCTKTLVDSIDDKEKELKIELPVKNKNLTFSRLAHWQYELMSKSGEISYAKAVKMLSEFLLQRKEVLEYTEAELKAEKFLEYAERRSIYFENNFTHKTFLEYFTAEYLYSTCIAKASDDGRKNLINIVSKYLPSSFWYIVFELLFTRIDRVQPDNELLDEVFVKQLDSNSLDVFYFFISNINKFNNISLEVKSKIVEKTVQLCIKGEKMKGEIRKGIRFEESSLIYKIHLLKENTESFNLLQQAIFKLENSDITDKQLIELYNLYYEISSFDFKGEALLKLQISNRNKLKELANEDLLLYSHVYLSSRINGEKFNVDILLNQIENFGSKSLFTHIPFRHKERSRRVATFDWYYINILESSDCEALKNDIYSLIDSGLKLATILSHVKVSKSIYYSRGRGLEKMMRLYLKSTDKGIDQLIEASIRVDSEMRMLFQKFKRDNPGHSKLKAIERLLEKREKGN